MSRSRILRLILALAIGGLGCSEDDRAAEAREVGTPDPSAPQILSVTMPPHLSVPRGMKLLAEVEVRVDDAYHVMANPASADYLIPLRLELPSSDGVEVASVIYPEGIPFVVEGLPESISTYEGVIVLTVPLTAAAGSRPGRRALRGNLHYQGCSQHTCLIPSSVPLEMEVEITE